MVPTIQRPAVGGGGEVGRHSEGGDGGLSNQMVAHGRYLDHVGRVGDELRKLQRYRYFGIILYRNIDTLVLFCFKIAILWYYFAL